MQMVKKPIGSKNKKIKIHPVKNSFRGGDCGKIRNIKRILGVFKC